jgi:hypothetical protein
MRTVLALALVVLAGCGKDRRPALQFTPDALPDGQVGQPYHVEIGVGGHHTPVGGMGAAGLPPGLVFTFYQRAAYPAVLEGVPTQPGTYVLKVDAWCYGTNVSGQTGGREYRIVIR